MKEQPDDSGVETTGSQDLSPLRSAFRPDLLVRRWKLPAAFCAAVVVGAMCLHGGASGHVAPPMQSVGKVVAKNAAPAMVAPDGGPGGGSGGSSAGGGIRGGFSLYEGVGGGVEFWFDPSTGDLTVAIGAGVGEGGEGVLGTYSPGSAPEPGTYSFVNATFATGTVATVNVSGEYSWANGAFNGSVGTTVAGRTVTLTSDGTASVTVSVTPTSTEEGFEGAVGVKSVFVFNPMAFIDDIIQDILDSLFGGDEIDDTDSYGGDDDGSVTDDDGTSADDDGTAADDGGDDAGDGDGGDGGGGGGGGGGDCDDASSLATVVMSSSLATVSLPGQRVAPQMEAPVDPCSDDDGDDGDDE